MKITALLLFSFFSMSAYAQDSEMEKVKDKDESSSTHGFKKENLFTGGGIQLSFSGNTFVGGASPIFGYSINKWIDAGIVANFIYYSNRHVTYYSPNTGQYFSSDDKLKQTVFGPGAFVKVFPVKFLFVQAQGEINFITKKLIYADGFPSEKSKYHPASLLLGLGYASGREGVGNFFYHISVSIDVLKDKNSPYVEELGNGKVNMLPIIRAGIQIPLFQGKRNNY
ncbi:MAG: hypothetical protein ABIO04_00155 [Ferruginibacter sp.]